MKRSLFLSAVSMVLFWFLLCQVPQDPSTMIENSSVELTIDSLSADSNGIFRDTIGKSISFHVDRKLGNLIDSFVIDFGGDTSMVFSTGEYQEDTFKIVYPFTSTGRKPIGIFIHFTNRAIRTVDSAVIIDIVNRLPGFLAGKPDTLYAIDDGDSIVIPIKASDTEGENLSFRISKQILPDSATAEIVGDISLVLFVPENSAGAYAITVEVSDTIDTVSATIKLAVTDKTPPLPPVFNTPSVVNTTTPNWEWESGGRGGSGTYRYVLDNNDFSGTKSTETDTTAFKSPSSLLEGTHTLFLQERDSSGNWSKTASWAMLIDQTGPAAPQVTGTTPTGDRTPTWTWTGSNADEPRFRIKLDSAKFTAADTVDTTATSYTPSSELSEGDHTLYVQEKDEAGNWSATGSFTIRIDTTGPQAPTLSGTTPTANRRPVWTWASNGGGRGYFRCALDSNVFSGNELFTSALTYIASSDLMEGDHTLYVQEQDTVGNWSLSGSSAVTIDVTPPGSPVFTSKTAQDTLQPEWAWISGGGGSGKYRYRLDNDDLAGVAPIATTSFRSPNNLSEGPHTFFLQEIDSTGNWSVVISQVVVVDTTPPAAPNVTGDVLTNNPRPAWTWIAGAGGDGTYRLKIDSNDMNSGTTSTDTTSYTPADPGLPEGAHWFYLQERDAAGNWSKTDSFLTTIDMTPPDTPDVFGSSLTNSFKPTWSWSSGVHGNGIGEYRYKLDSGDLTTGATVTTSTSFSPSGDLSETDHTLYVQERDAADNWSPTGSFTTTIDATAAGAPLVTGVSPTNNTKPTWNWVSGGGSGSFRYKLDSQDFSTGATETNGVSFTPGSDLPAGVHILFVQENDGAGNWSATGLFVVQIDLVPPSAPTVAGETPTNDRTPTWSWQSVDGAGAFRFKLDSDDVTSGATESNETSFTPGTDLNGSHTLYLQERDAAGNWSSTASFVIVIDTTAPLAPVVAGTTPTNDRTPMWTWVPGGGGNGSFRYKIDDGEFSAGTTELQFIPDADITEGSHTLYVQERDVAGNWSASGERTIVVDVTPPGPPTITGPALTNDATPTWTWSSGGGMGAYRWRLDQSDIDGAPVATEDTFYTLPAVSGDEEHVLYIKEQDSAGNWSSSASFRIKIDVTKPGKPTFISGTTGSPSGTKVLTWVWQSGGDGNGTFRYMLDLASWGAETAVTTYTSPSLAEGLHTLSIAERDDAGNWSDSASYVIYVLPAPSNLTIASTNVDTGWGEKLTWTDNSTSENKFYIYRKGVLCTPSKIGTICRPYYFLIDSVGANVHTYIDVNVTSCDTFTYYVAAVRDNVGRTNSETVSHKAVRPGTLCFIIIDPPIIREPIQLLGTDNTSLKADE